jgi:hypothetical protein
VCGGWRGRGGREGCWRGRGRWWGRGARRGRRAPVGPGSAGEARGRGEAVAACEAGAGGCRWEPGLHDYALHVRWRQTSAQTCTLVYIVSSRVQATATARIPNRMVDLKIFTCALSASRRSGMITQAMRDGNVSLRVMVPRREARWCHTPRSAADAKGDALRAPTVRPRAGRWMRRPARNYFAGCPARASRCGVPVHGGPRLAGARVGVREGEGVGT